MSPPLVASDESASRRQQRLHRSCNDNQILPNRCLPNYTTLLIWAMTDAFASPHNTPLAILAPRPFLTRACPYSPDSYRTQRHHDDSPSVLCALPGLIFEPTPPLPATLPPPRSFNVLTFIDMDPLG